MANKRKYWKGYSQIAFENQYSWQFYISQFSWDGKWNVHVQLAHNSLSLCVCVCVCVYQEHVYIYGMWYSLQFKQNSVIKTLVFPEKWKWKAVELWIANRIVNIYILGIFNLLQELLQNICTRNLMNASAHSKSLLGIKILVVKLVLWNP